MAREGGLCHCLNVDKQFCRIEGGTYTACCTSGLD